MIRRRKGQPSPAPSVPRFTAPCAVGLEEMVAAEIRECGGHDVEPLSSAVRWQGGLESGYRACLWSRHASRVLLELARFPAPDPDAVYKGAESVDWPRIFHRESSFAVDCTLRDAAITHGKFAALRVKDAVADCFRIRFNARPSVDTLSPDLRINLHVEGGEGILSLDLAGDGLHRRGYRVARVEAPLKETLAAALVRLAGWDGNDPGLALLDPMCGSGTLLIEAAMLFGDVAPGLSRTRFGFLAWRGHDPELWQRLVDEAVAREEAALDRDWPAIIGWDNDPAAVNAARANVERAGLTGRINIERRPLARFERPSERGLLITNPPYGERLGEAEEVRWLHRCLGREIHEHLPGWCAAVYTSGQDLADQLGAGFRGGPWLHNGPLRCRLYLNDQVEAEQAEEFSWQVQAAPEGTAVVDGTDFANRLRKNLGERLGWAAAGGVSCFRVYDRDLPDYNLAIDLYERWVLVQEYKPPATIPEETAAARLRLALRLVREVLGVNRNRIFLKERRRQKGKDQYERKPGADKLHEVREGDCRFLVNFTGYLDVGLFLDHRDTRRLLAEIAAGKRFLNLFGYTGTATVHAAMAGARTCTVDLSTTYLSRARANLALNGLGGRRHRFIQADVMAWLPTTDELFDCIFVAPPTFSNTAKKQRVFDVQQDHAHLLELAMGRLAPGGTLVFSTNFQGFELDSGLAERYAVEEITARTVPRDFCRTPRVHRCWMIQRG